MAVIPLTVSGGGRQVVLREVSRFGGSTRIFPRTVLPPIVTINSAGPHSFSMTHYLTIGRRIQWTWVILHTTHIGEYRMSKDIVYERLW